MRCHPMDVCSWSAGVHAPAVSCIDKIEMETKKALKPFYEGGADMAVHVDPAIKGQRPEA